MDTDRILRRKEIEAWIGLGRSSIYAMMSTGDFPRPIRIGKRAVGWRYSDVSHWLAGRVDEALDRLWIKIQRAIKEMRTRYV